MTIRKFSIGDDLAYFDNFFGFGRPTLSCIKGEFYNPEEYDLVPRKSFKEKQLKFKEQRLQELKERRKNDNQHYDEQEKELQLEIDTLRQKLLSP